MDVPETSVLCGCTDKPVCASCDCVYLKKMIRVFCQWIVPVLETSVLCSLGDNLYVPRVIVYTQEKMFRVCFCL
jgi:hypothetical protein